MYIYQGRIIYQARLFGHPGLEAAIMNTTKYLLAKIQSPDLNGRFRAVSQQSASSSGRYSALRRVFFWQEYF